MSDIDTDAVRDRIGLHVTEPAATLKRDLLVALAVVDRLRAEKEDLKRRNRELRHRPDLAPNVTAAYVNELQAEVDRLRAEVEEWEALGNVAEDGPDA